MTPTGLQRAMGVVRVRNPERRPGAGTLAGLNLICAAMCLIALYAPITKNHSTVRDLGFGVAFFLGAPVVFFFSHRLPRSGLVMVLVIDVALESMVVGRSQSNEGTIIVSFTYIWWGIYAASFFDRRWLSLSLGAVSIASLAAFAVNGIAFPIAVWVVLMATTWSTAVIVHRSVGRLRFEAETDALTGLLNRRGFLKAAGYARSVADRFEIRLAVAVLDLDHFKWLNDSEGHAAGDRALIGATSAWRRTLRDGDLLARFGGDEFVMLLADLPSDSAEDVLRRCLLSYPLSFTAGVARLGPGEELETAIASADEQLYEAKLAREMPEGDRFGRTSQEARHRS